MWPILNKRYLKDLHRKAARFVNQEYSKYNSVTIMIHKLGWTNVQDKRKGIRLTMPCKIINEIANTPNKEILIPTDTNTRSKYGHKFHKLTNNTNQYK